MISRKFLFYRCPPNLLASHFFPYDRPQLCGVWVATSSNPSSFEVLNDAVRKYDALRWKYVDAYIDIMRLCKRLDVLKTFAGWVDASPRDLPAFYDVSASMGGGAPDTLHSKETLLKGSGLIWYAKRRANQAIVKILQQELTETETGVHNDSIAKRIDIFKEAFSCFLRMNAPLNDRLWRSQKIEDGEIIEVDMICRAYQNLENDSSSADMQMIHVGPDNTIPSRKEKFSLLHRAVSKCEEMFPELVPMRQRRKAKRQTSKGSQKETAAGTAESKPSALGGSSPADPSKEKDKNDKEQVIEEEKSSQKADVDKSPASSEKTKQKKKKKAAPKAKDASTSSTKKKKEKTPAAKKSTIGKKKKEKASKSFKAGEYTTVDVPSGLGPGEKFDVTINVEGTKKKFKLKVPEGGNHKKLKFKVPEASKSKTKV